MNSKTSVGVFMIISLIGGCAASAGWTGDRDKRGGPLDALLGTGTGAAQGLLQNPVQGLLQPVQGLLQGPLGLLGSLLGKRELRELEERRKRGLLDGLLGTLGLGKRSDQKIDSKEFGY